MRSNNNDVGKNIDLLLANNKENKENRENRVKNSEYVPRYKVDNTLDKTNIDDKS